MTGVYFVRYRRMVKVGYSRNIPARVRMVRHFMGGGKLIGTIETETASEARQAEAEWCRRLTPWLASGREWFHASPDALSVIMAGSQPPVRYRVTKAELSEIARGMVKLRWANTTPEQRRDYALMMVEARRQKRRRNGKPTASR